MTRFSHACLALCLAICHAHLNAADTATLACPVARTAAECADALIKDGFNFTGSFRWERDSPASTIRQEMLFPGGGNASQLLIWMQNDEGVGTVRLIGPDGKVHLDWSSKKGELSLRREIPRGKYVFEINTPTMGGEALFAVKGSVRAVAALPPRAEEFSAAPERGFHWPYYLYMPKDVRTAHLLVAPNNTGMVTQDVEWLRAAAKGDLQKHVKLAEQLGSPLLIPMFPRPEGDENLYLHALTRASMEATRPAFKRVDLQLLAMVADARTRLAKKGAKLDPRMLMWGFSASGSFVNRFAFLHPDNVLAVASGSPGGWPIAPLESFNGDKLGYPVGLADIASLTGSAVSMPKAKDVAWLIYMGDQDANDAVVFRDSFTAADEQQIFKHFGPTPIARWQKIASLYAEQGLNARFTLYPNAAHAVTAAMHADIATFFEGEIKRSGK